MTSYKTAVCDVFIHSGESVISQQDFKLIEEFFGVSEGFVYVKIENAHIPVFPEWTVPRESVVISEADAERFDIEEEYSKPLFFMKPEAIAWM